jgi:hypothetical protein
VGGKLTSPSRVGTGAAKATEEAEGPVLKVVPASEAEMEDF